MHPGKILPMFCNSKPFDKKDSVSLYIRHNDHCPRTGIFESRRDEFRSGSDMGTGKEDDGKEQQNSSSKFIEHCKNSPLEIVDDELI